MKSHTSAALLLFIALNSNALLGEKITEADFEQMAKDYQKLETMKSVADAPGNPSLQAKYIIKNNDWCFPFSKSQDAKSISNYFKAEPVCAYVNYVYYSVNSGTMPNRCKLQFTRRDFDLFLLQFEHGRTINKQLYMTNSNGVAKYNSCN